MPGPMHKTRHPGIYKRGNRYVVVWRHHGRQHKSFHRTLDEAREAKATRDGGDRRPSTKVAFEDYARAWIETYQGRTSRGFGKSARAQYRAALELHAIPHFRRQRLDQIEPPDIRAFISALEAKGLAPSSIRKTVAPVRALLATAHEDGQIRSNPSAGVRINTRRDDDRADEAKAMTRAELARFLLAADPQWRLFFELLAHTGLRISELLGLSVGDVTFGRKPMLNVEYQFCRGERRRLKTKASRRELPLAPKMAKRLKAQCANRDRSAPLFPSGAGTPRSATNLFSRVLKPTRTKAGLPWVNFHSFRHTCASLLFAGGKNIRQVADWLGHADPAFTLRTYVHLMDEGLGDADFMDDAVVVRLDDYRPARRSQARATA